jgi:hypothetical protein
MSNFISLPNPTRVFKSSTLPLPAPSCQYALRGSAARYPYHEKRGTAVPRLFFTKKKSRVSCMQASTGGIASTPTRPVLDPSLAADLHCAGLDWTGLPWSGWVLDRESRILAPLLAQLRMMCFTQVSYAQGSSNISPDGGSLPMCHEAIKKIIRLFAFILVYQIPR